MPGFTQATKPLAFTTPLGEDALLLETLTGHESISELFEFELDLLAAPDEEIPFDKLLGQPAAVVLRNPDEPVRYFHGIVNRFSQGAEVRGPEGLVTFVRYRATLVPELWLLTRNSRSRIFQQMTVPDILKAVFAGFAVTFELIGEYEPRDYCVQYREDDLAFAARLMEEEGIFYFFAHTEDGHDCVVSDHRDGHVPSSDPAELEYDTVVGGNRPRNRITSWTKTQELRSGVVTLWDHNFEAAHHNLEARATIQKAVEVGTITHALNVDANAELELYDFPGNYAKRFDGVDPGGSDRAADIDKIFNDNTRTTKLRMEQEAAQGLEVAGESDCHHLSAGHTFELARHFNADGQYVLTWVEHSASVGDAYISGSDGYDYQNWFWCIPFGLPYRPGETAARPSIPGTQTA